MLKELMREILKEELTGKTVTESEDDSPYIIGKHYHVRTVTMAIAGTLKAVYENELIFANASWVADTGRFNEYLKNTSKVKENEPFHNDVIIGRGSIIDCVEVSKVYESAK